jgi:hypothetical protein
MRGRISKEMKLLFPGILVLLLIAILANCNGDSGNSVVGPQKSGGENTCCWRQINTTFTAPPQQSTKILVDAWDSIFTTSASGGGPLLDDCPLKVDILDHGNTEYTFVGNLTAEGSGTGEYNVHVQLMDNANGTVVKEDSRSWRSDPLDTPQGSADVHYNVKKLAKTFVPLDDLLFVYEGLPQTASVSPKKDPINAGEQMTIQVSVRTSDDSVLQPWQWVIAQVEKGKILNGIPNGKGEGGVEWRRFRAEGGMITLQYQAPQGCSSDSEDTETIIVYNTCNVDEPNLTRYLPEDEIGRATFDITCSSMTFIGEWTDSEGEYEMWTFKLIQNGDSLTGSLLRETAWSVPSGHVTSTITESFTGTIDGTSAILHLFGGIVTETWDDGVNTGTTTWPIEPWDLAVTLLDNGRILRFNHAGEERVCIRQ